MKYNEQNAKRILAALQAAGAPATAIPFLLAQVAHETGNFDSRVFRQNNNASGIMFINKPARQKNASRGLAFPRKEWPSASQPLYYANFATLTDWARDFLRIVGAVVLKSQTPEEYAAKLKARKYYAAPLAVYSAALKAHLSRLQKLGLLSMPASGGSVLPILIFAGIGFALYALVK